MVSMRVAAIPLVFAATIAVLAFPRVTIAADEAAGLTGRWALNRERSEFPQELGFSIEIPSSAGGSSNAQATRTGGRGRGRSSGGAATPIGGSRPESFDDAARRERLTEEVRNPGTQLSIVDIGSSVAITDDRGQTRTVHPDGRREVLRLGDTPVGVVSKRDGTRLVVLYDVENGRELRYTYSVAPDRTELLVDVQFLERGTGDTVRRVYRSTEGQDLSPALDSARPAAAPAQPQSPAAAPAAQAVDQRPDAELKGLRSLSVVVEGVTQASVACGLNQQTLEAEMARAFKDAGIQVVQITDNDTYAYVNLTTSNVTSSLCVSRYDVSVSTHTSAVLRYRDKAALVEVLLLHKGGLAGGSPTVHASEVLKAVKESATEFAARIRDANR